jgi:biopolymer transport protein ExbB
MTEALIRWLETTPMAPFGELLAMGGPVMLVLTVLAFAGLTAGLYALFISILSSPRCGKQLDQSLADWKAGDFQRAHETLENSRNPLATLLGFTLKQRRIEKDDQALREEVSRRAQKLFTPFEPPLKLLEVIAALAPLLGLLGTVMGMMAAFSAMATAQGGADPNQLSGGIYEALTTTAAGLIIAIPAAAIAAWLDYRMRRQRQLVNDLLTQALSGRQQVGMSSATPLDKSRAATHPTHEVREASHATG